MFFCKNSCSSARMPLSHGLYTLMISDGFPFSLFIVIAMTSLNGKASGVTCAAAMILLFVYIAERGGVSFVPVVGSASVHAWCRGDELVYADQYCSWIMRIAYCFMSGSFSM